MKLFVSLMISMVIPAWASVTPDQINFKYTCARSKEQPKDAMDVEAMSMTLRGLSISFKFPDDDKTYRGKVAETDLDLVGDRHGAGGAIVYNSDIFNFYDDSWPFQDTRLYVDTELTTGAAQGRVQIRSYVWDEPVVQAENFDCRRLQ